MAHKVGIDLGTTSTRIFVPKKGVVLNEPSVVAKELNSRKVMALGMAAQAMVGRTPESIELFRPLVDGVIADFNATQTMLRHFLNTALSRVRLAKPDIMISVSGGATSTERKAVYDAAAEAGGRRIYLITQSVAAAIGANVAITEPSGNMVIDVGAGTAEICVISLGGVVASSSVRAGGNRIDRTITNYLRRDRGLSIGENMAEEVKKTVGTAMPERKHYKMDVKGRDLVTGLPRTVVIDSHELVEPIQDIIERIVYAARTVLEKTPPELVSDIIDHGIVLSGGTAMLRNLDQLLTKVIGVPVIKVEDPLNCVATGIGLAMSDLAEWQQSQLSF